MNRRLTLLLVLALSLLLPAVASAEDSCSTDLAAVLAAEAAAPPAEAAAASLDEILAGTSEATPVLIGCDKTWCSERRFECKNDCLPCGFAFTCYVLQCSYSCQCVC